MGSNFGTTKEALAEHHSHLRNYKKVKSVKEIQEAMDLSYLQPDDNCKKCGNKIWFYGPGMLTWHCIMCGNMTYMHFGEFLQQIEIVMNSHRRHEYVYSPDKKSIMPKKNSKLKELKRLGKIENIGRSDKPITTMQGKFK